MRGWGPIRTLLVEREQERETESERERELKWLHNSRKKNSHSFPLFLPESLQNLINSKPRLLFFTSKYLLFSTQRRAPAAERPEMSHPFDVNGKPALGQVMSSGPRAKD